MFIQSVHDVPVAAVNRFRGDCVFYYSAADLRVPYAGRVEGSGYYVELRGAVH